jgi:hypothetical protein
MPPKQIKYTGEEPALELKQPATIEPESVFEIKPAKVPPGATPIFDEESKVVIGYRFESTTGLYRFYDLDGNQVGMEEKGLETPLISPIDLILMFGTLFRVLGKGTISMGTRLAAVSGTRLTTRVVGGVVVASMRACIREISIKSLKFTSTTAARMATQGRYVPVHILRLAIKYGKRLPDSQGIKGAFQYTIPMLRNGKQYLLEVVVREKDWTILHFLYK